MDAAACRRQALGFLARREHSRLELERKLASRAYPKALVAETLDDLEADGSLRASRFAESFVRVRADRGQGPLRIRMELRERGIDDSEAAAALESRDYDWVTIARRAREKRFGPDLPAVFAERSKQARFLEYRGFGHAQIRAVLDADSDSD
jgi:regulatory protein